MATTNKALFQLMRFNILNSGHSDLGKSPFSLAYIYAWQRRVYPAFDESAEWHKPFPEQFRVTEEKVSELFELLNVKWKNKETITFYELEDYYKVSDSTNSSSNWDRGKLIITCRYIYLSDMFISTDSTDVFWAALAKGMDCPSEAYSICLPLDKSKIYLM